jgi:hypothetical protein
VPHEAYQFFVDKFVDAIRFEIARSAEKAYDSLRLADTNRLFMIPTDTELRTFIASNNNKEGVEKSRSNSKRHVIYMYISIKIYIFPRSHSC